MRMRNVERASLAGREPRRRSRRKADDRWGYGKVGLVAMLCAGLAGAQSPNWDGKNGHHEPIHMERLRSEMSRALNVARKKAVEQDAARKKPRPQAEVVALNASNYNDQVREDNKVFLVIYADQEPWKSAESTLKELAARYKGKVLFGKWRYGQEGTLKVLERYGIRTDGMSPVLPTFVLIDGRAMRHKWDAVESDATAFRAHCVKAIKDNLGVE